MTLTNRLTKYLIYVNLYTYHYLEVCFLTDKNKILLNSVGGLALFTLGGYRIFTNNLEAMSILVAYIFFICGFIGFVFNVVKLSKTPRT